jgi:hypothetical protein
MGNVGDRAIIMSVSNEEAKQFGIRFKIVLLPGMVEPLILLSKKY